MVASPATVAPLGLNRRRPGIRPMPGTCTIQVVDAHRSLYLALMGVGVSYRSMHADREFDEPERLRPVLVALAATIGVLGPFAAIRGWGPVTLSHATRPAGLLTVVAVAAVAAGWLSWMSKPSPTISVPALVLAGAVATWPTSGRVQGAWCVAATAAAVGVVRVLAPRTRSSTKTLLAVVGLALAAAAGAAWARTGPGIAAPALLGLALVVGVAAPRQEALTTNGDQHLDRLWSGLQRTSHRWAASTRVSVSRSLGWVRARTTTHRAELASGAATAAVMFPAFLPLVSDTSRTSVGFTDYELHMYAAETTHLVPFTTMTPHWLLQVLTAMIRPFAGLHVAAAAVLAASCGLAVAVLAHRAGRDHGVISGPAPLVAALIGTVAFWLDAPTAFLNTVGWLSPARPFAPLHAWGSPTDTLAFPLLLLLVLAVARFVDEEGPPWFRPTPARLALSVVTIATILTKPNLPMVMVGIVPLLILLRHGWCFRRLATTALWVGAPTTAVLALQFRHMHVSRAIGEYDPGGWGVTIDPFAFLDLWVAPQGGVWFWISAPVVVLLGVWVLGRRFWHDPTLNVAQVALLVSLVPMALLRETGLHANDGNFMKAAYGATMVLVALTAVEIGRELWLQHSPHATWSAGQRRRRVAATAAVGAPFLLGGAAVYVTTLAPGLTPGSIWPGA